MGSMWIRAAVESLVRSRAAAWEVHRVRVRPPAWTWDLIFDVIPILVLLAYLAVPVAAITLLGLWLRRWRRRRL